MNTHPTGNRVRLAASAALLAGVALHGVDHALQERGIGALTTEVLVGGLVNATLAVIAFVFAMRDHPRAPAVAAGVGAYLVVGVSAAHFAPHWSAFSDPYKDADLEAISYVLALATAAAGVALAAVAVITRGARGGATA